MYSQIYLGNCYSCGWSGKTEQKRTPAPGSSGEAAPQRELEVITRQANAKQDLQQQHDKKGTCRAEIMFTVPNPCG